MRTRTIKIKPKQINYVMVGDKLPFAFWVQYGIINVSLINNEEYSVNVVGTKEPSQ